MFLCATLLKLSSSKNVKVEIIFIDKIMKQLKFKYIDKYQRRPTIQWILEHKYGYLVGGGRGFLVDDADTGKIKASLFLDCVS